MVGVGSGVGGRGVPAGAASVADLSVTASVAAGTGLQAIIRNTTMLLVKIFWK